MTMLANYKTKSALKASIGKPLKYQETTAFGPEYTPNGWNTVAHRPHLQGGREWFARVLVSDGKISKVE